MRQAKGWSIKQAVIQAKGKGHSITAYQLRWLEEGKTKAPDGEALRAVSAIYGLSYVALALEFISSNYGSDLLRHIVDQRSDLQNGGLPPDELPTSARRIAELETELAAFKTRWREVQDVARALTRIAIPDEGETIGAATAKGHRVSRKAVR